MQISLESNCGLDLLYQDEQLFILNKPSHLHTVMLPKELQADTTANDSIAGRLLQLEPELGQVAPKPTDAGLVQRLDFETSGVLVGAKTRASWNAIYSSIKSGQTKKRYLVVTEGEFQGRKLVHGWIGSAARRAKKSRFITSEEYRPESHARYLESNSNFEGIAYNRSLNVSLVLASAPTARRHQIRVHLAELGHPLVGDALYGATSNLGVRQAGFVLHAWEVVLKHPSAGTELTVRAEIPTLVKELFSPLPYPCSEG